MVLVFSLGIFFFLFDVDSRLWVADGGGGGVQWWC